VRAYGTLEASIQIFLEDVAVRPITPEIWLSAHFFLTTTRTTPPIGSSVAPPAPKG